VDIENGIDATSAALGGQPTLELLRTLRRARNASLAAAGVTTILTDVARPTARKIQIAMSTAHPAMELMRRSVMNLQDELNKRVSARFEALD
jgi:ABC-type uncharacterized transport system substrate-binding protein